MANLGSVFDANSVEPSQVSEPIPAGKYQVQIVNSEMRPTKNGLGQYLWMELVVTDGQFANRRLFDRLNLINQNPQAVEIAQRTLSAICHATGQLSVSDSEQLHNRPMVAKVEIKPADGQYAAANEVKGYEAVSGRPATAVAAPSTAAAPATAAKVAPWKRASAA